MVAVGVGGGLIICNLEKRWGTIWLESQNRPCVVCCLHISGPDSGSFINHWLTGNRQTLWIIGHFICYIPGAIWLPREPLLWAAGPEHSEARVRLKRELEWTQGVGTEPKGERLNSNLADSIHLPVTDPSLTEAVGDINGMSRKFNLLFLVTRYVWCWLSR